MLSVQGLRLRVRSNLVELRVVLAALPEADGAVARAGRHQVRVVQRRHLLQGGESETVNTPDTLPLFYSQA